MSAEETLSYYIRAFDLATPVFRAFGGEVEATTRRVQASLATMNRSLMEQTAVTNKMTTAQHDAMKASVATRGEMAAVGTAAGGMKHDVSTATTEIQKHKNSIEQAGYALSGFAGQLGPLGRSMDTSMKHAQLFRSQGIDYLAAGLVGAGATVVAFGTKANLTFDAISRQIQTQAGTSSRVTAQLLTDVKKVSTEAPASFQQIAQAVAAQERLFGNNNATIQKNTDLFLAFADKAQTQVIPTIQNLHQAMILWHPAGMSVVDMMDQLVNLANKTQQPLSGYLGILTKYGPALKTMGLSFTQAIGLFDAFAQHGLSANQMGRGLTSAFTKATTEIKAASTALQDHGQKLRDYQASVNSAQIAVNRLSGQVAAGKGNTQQYADELVVAQERLQSAKDKMDAYTKSTKDLSAAHESVTQVVGKELAAIESAKSKQDALNLSVQTFGGQMGPKMAMALYHNKTALDHLQKSLGDAKGSTDNLAKAQRDTLGGQLSILSHDFDILASKVGLSSSGLKGIVHDMSDVVKAVSGIPKPVLEALFGGGVALGATSLLLRHTPLGGMVARATGAGDAMTALLAGKSATGQAIARGGTAVGGLEQAMTGGIFGFSGSSVRVGSEMNPIAVVMAGGSLPGAPMGGPATAVTDAERLAQAELPMAVGAQQMSMFGRGVGVGATPGEQLALESTVPTNTIAQTEAMASTGILATVRSGMGSMMGGLMKGGMIAGMGVMGSQLLGGMIGGGAGRAVSSIGTGASIGAGIGSFLGPEGTALGAGAGALVGGVKDLFSGGTSPTAQASGDVAKLQKQLAGAIKAGDVQQIVKLSAAARDAANQMTGLTQKAGYAGINLSVSALQMNKLATAGDTAALKLGGRGIGGILSNDLPPQLQKFQGQLTGVQGSLNNLSPAALERLQTQAQILASDPSLSKYQGQLNTIATATQDALTKKVVPYFQQMADESGKSLAQIDQAVKISSVMIPQTLGAGSQAAAKALSQNFMIAIQDVQHSMAAGVVSTSQGIAEIDKLMSQALHALGSKVTPADVKAIGLQGALGLIGAAQTGATAPLSGGTFATGGRVPGPVGPDNWTLLDPSGRPAGKVGGGELLIANRHSEAAISAATMEKYGKTAGQLVAGETTPHSAPGYATGGWVATAYGPPWGGINGGGVTATGINLTNAPHDYIIAVDPSVIPMHSNVTVQPNPFGYTGTFRAEDTGGAIIGHHIDIYDWEGRASQNAWGVRDVSVGVVGGPVAGKAGVAPLGGGGVTTVPRIKQPKWSGPGGEIGAIGQAVLQQVTAAANKKLQSQAAMAIGGGGGVKLLPGGQRSEPIPKGASPGLQAMISEANAIASHNYNYEWGGGHGAIGVPSHWSGSPSHGSGPGVGFDCSGAVSAVLHAGGLLASPLAAASFMSWGLPGAGQTVSIFADSGHTFMELAGHYFGTSTAFNPGGGANWMTGFPGNIGGPRHPPGYEKGGWAFDPSQASPSDRIIDGLLPGMNHGGRVHPHGHPRFTAEGPQYYDAAYQFFRPYAEDPPYSGSYMTPLKAPYEKQFEQWVKGNRVPFDLTEKRKNDYDMRAFWMHGGQWAGGSTHFPDTWKTPYDTTFSRESNYANKRNPFDWVGNDLVNMNSGQIIYAPPGHNKGGQVGYAGAFGQGGAFTAHSPTMALFGDNGAEDVVAIPHAQTGGVFTTNAAAPTVGTTPYVPPSSTSSSSTHTSKALNPITGKVETHTTAEWHAIHTQAAVDRAAAAAAKKKFDAYMAQTVQTTLTASGMVLGSFDSSRKLQQSEFGDVVNKQGKIDLLGDLQKLTVTAWNKIVSTLKSALGGMTLGQQIHAAGSLTGALATGADAGLVHHQGRLEKHISTLNQQGDKAQAMAERLHKEAMAEHGRQRQRLLDQAHKDSQLATHDRKIAHHDQRELGRVQTKIAGSRPAQLANVAISAGLSAMSSRLSAQSTQFSKTQSIDQLLEGLAPGTSLASVFGGGKHGQALAHQMLGASGLSLSAAKGLIGAGAGPASYAQQVKLITDTEIPAYQADAKRLQALYKDALKTHNTKLQNSLKSQMDQVTQSMLQAQADLTTAMVGEVDAVASKYTKKATKEQSAADMLATIQGFAPGTSLAGMGLSPTVLKQLGIDPTQATSLEGSSISYFQNLQSQQGGMLTPAQLAKAQAGTTAQDKALGGERTTDIQGLQALEKMLPTLKGDAKTEAQNQITTLVQAILGLTTSIGTNDASMKALTASVTANTSATTTNTGAMTGSVGFTYQGQNYVAGGSLTSDTESNTGVGI